MTVLIPSLEKNKENKGPSIKQIIRGRKLLISGDPTHLQFLSYEDVQELITKYFIIEEIEILKGGKLSNKFPKIFARNIAFRCSNKNP